MENNMKKIAILTLNGYYNYGNRLQNYATQEVLKSLGFDVETVPVDRSNNSDKKLSKRLARVSSISELKTKIRIRIKNYLNKDIIRERKDKFIRFTKEHINETEYTISNNDIPIDFSKRYDYFIVGSDQVWNPNNLHGTSFYFLTFTENRKRISYAASFAISEIPDEYIERYKKWLSEMHRISVREEAGAKIVKELIGKDAEVLVDPTIMLSKESWLSIAKEADYKPQKGYVLAYFLGNILKETKNKINEIAKENKLEIINLTSMKNKRVFTSGPSEFIDLVSSASLLYTDSFHGVVFSILMKTPFIVFDRISNLPSMFSRIDTLLEKFKLESRKSDQITTNEQIFEVDYSHIAPILEFERKKALDYLKEALHVKTKINNRR
jgi:hypothetical protein